MTETATQPKPIELPGAVSQELREMLDAIDEFLSRSNNASQRLWDVLTALRGPDDGDERTKVTTTTHIRASAFPRSVIHSGVLCADFSTDKPFKIPDDHLHFAAHVAYAARALGLESK